MEIKKEDFSLFSKREKSSGSNFCGNCDEEVSSSDCDKDGYTYCCNEPVIGRSDFLKAAKFISISDFLEKFPFEAFIYEIRDYPFGHKIRFTEKNIEFSVSLKSDLSVIISQINDHLSRV